MATQPAPDGRHRDVTGEIHRKQGNTLVGTLRQTYGEDFLSEFRSDAMLSTVLAETGAESLTQLVKEHRK